MFRPIQYNNVRFYLFIYFSLCFKASPRPTSEIDLAAEFPSCRPSGTKKGHQPPNNLLWLFFFYCTTPFIRGARSVLPWLRPVCLVLPYRGHLNELMSKRLLFIFFFFILCAYVLRGRCAHWRPATTTRGFDLFLCRIDAEMEAEFHRSTSFTAFSRHLFSFYCLSTQLKFSPPALVNCPKSKIWYTIFF